MGVLCRLKSNYYLIMSKDKEQNCWQLIANVAEELGKLEEYGADVSECRRLHTSLILGLCKENKLAETKEEFLEGFNSYYSPFPRLFKWFKRQE